MKTTTIATAPSAKPIVPRKTDERFTKQARKLLKTNPLAGDPDPALVRSVARALHRAYYEGRHEGARNSYC